MAKVNCKCGEQLSDEEGTIFWVFGDDEIDNNAIDPDGIKLPDIQAWFCGNCGRVYLYRDGESIPFKTLITEPEA